MLILHEVYNYEKSSLYLCGLADRRQWRPLRKRVLLQVTGGKITSIDRFDSFNCPNPHYVTDLSHCTILPPLVDSHVHLSMSGTIDKRARQPQLEAGYKESARVITRHIHYNFTHGVLGVRDGGDGKGHVLRYKNEDMGYKKNPVVLKASVRAWQASW